MTLVAPFEEVYRKNLREAQQRNMLAGRANPGPQQQPPGNIHGRPNSMGGFTSQGTGPQGNTPNMNMTAMGQPIHPNQAQGLDSPLLSAGAGQFAMPQNLPHATQLSQQPSSSGLNIPDARPNIIPTPDTLLGPTASSQAALSNGLPAFSGGVPEGGSSDFDSDPEGRKRKLRDSEDPESKRVRQKTGETKSIFHIKRTLTHSARRWFRSIRLAFGERLLIACLF